jgi:hypothetical protein
MNAVNASGDHQDAQGCRCRRCRRDQSVCPYGIAGDRTAIAANKHTQQLARAHALATIEKDGSRKRTVDRCAAPGAGDAFGALACPASTQLSPALAPCLWAIAGQRRDCHLFAAFSLTGADSDVQVMESALQQAPGPSVRQTINSIRKNSRARDVCHAATASHLANESGDHNQTATLNRSNGSQVGRLSL